MPEKTKQNESEAKEEKPEESLEDEEGAWSRDQREKSYYYDDSYGYEVYNSDDDEDDGD